MGEYVKNDCHKCINKREVPGNYHIKCVKPDADMVGNKHGIREGWFMYPLLFDPVWMEKECCNFESVISEPVSGVGESK